MPELVEETLRYRTQELPGATELMAAQCARPGCAHELRRHMLDNSGCCVHGCKCGAYVAGAVEAA